MPTAAAGTMLPSEKRGPYLKAACRAGLAIVAAALVVFVVYRGRQVPPRLLHDLQLIDAAGTRGGAGEWAGREQTAPSASTGAGGDADGQVLPDEDDQKASGVEEKAEGAQGGRCSPTGPHVEELQADHGRQACEHEGDLACEAVGKEARGSGGSWSALAESEAAAGEVEDDEQEASRTHTAAAADARALRGGGEELSASRRDRVPHASS